MKVAVIQFPGSSSDVLNAARLAGIDAAHVDYRETSLDTYDGVLIPSGASFGNYLRPGAIAAVAPIVPAIKQAAADNKPVVGIQNGFQILTEIGLLPGSLAQNKNVKFINRNESITVSNSNSPFTQQLNQTVAFPIAHAVGQYMASEETLNQLEENNQIIFTYTNNPNGSALDIAGITNEAGNVLGLMPHPERATDKILGSDDGLQLFKNIANWGQQ
ncbi:phosphoribosylformylglycinamidine synthase subunit PurQ [Aliicoccus persicus]|uniref:Phosphoribosylformylglycinamidine synthase subunit PurQ n=1 Tax=Aliicoccus persicus TaxID=930138 RepID=A0A662Z3L6_9STAP|nr:phosphoribosylformylglycinamidine synthase subunit PurQ [Aliicoccus persicus]SEW03507.1 phosphoribosylformylglycinamidine synthase subunit I [Aliicoccus persicus]